MKERFPVLFTGHGSPMNAIGNNRARKSWIEIGERIKRPKVIIAISAHWMTEGLHIRRAEKNIQINDMYGFPEELYNIVYEPDGSIEYADRVIELFGEDIKIDNEWGIDHGLWSVLSNIYPDADIPVVILSTDISATPEEIYNVGRKLRKLRDEGAMIIASGNIVHNLSLVGWEMDDGYDWADSFDSFIKDSILSRDFISVINYENAEGFFKSVPTKEHYYPLLVAIGSAYEEDEVEAFNDYRELGSMSMTSYLFDSRI